MNGQASFTFLGTGASTGVPVIGCRCATCSSSLPENRRLRSSLCLQVQDQIFLFDVGPDFRQQALSHHIQRIDALFITHTHYDHIAGIDDARLVALMQRQSMPLFLSQESLEILATRYAYFFHPMPQDPSLAVTRATPWIFHPLSQSGGSFSVGQYAFSYFHYFQREMKVTGYRLGHFAYVTDIRTYEDAIFSWLNGVRYLIVSALRTEPSHAHFSLQEAVEFVNRAGAERGWITHISHHMEHREASALLPSHVQMGYDGLSVRLETL